MKARTVLISGAGIAGPTLAYWLLRYGFTPTLIERAPRLRTGGYVIDFWGAGYDIAERMSLIPDLTARGYHVRELRFVNSEGHRVGGFDTRVLDKYTNGRFTSLPRGQLEASIYQTVAPSIETIFGDEITGIENDQHEVRVRFERAAPRSFDLLIGADGLHSGTRRLAFGSQSDFEVRLGYQVAAAELVGYRPRDELVYVAYSQVGQQVARFAMRDDRTLILFVFRDEGLADGSPEDASPHKAILRSRFWDSGWECRSILEAIRPDEDLYFDRVSQIRMPSWTKGRVALVGDAAFCVSLLAGQGSALAMVAAYVLAGELKRADGDHQLAFERYEQRLASFIASKQRAAVGFARSLVPASRLGMFVRNQGSKLLGLPLIARLAFGRSLIDKIELPSY
jgi:2-polyprenyl-6-methoxyphenol hydroxylase-like FAD-dependent oxidoreductase